MVNEIEKLRARGIQGSDNELDYLVRSCGFDIDLLDYAVTSLLKPGEGKAGTLENPDIFKSIIQDLMQYKDGSVASAFYIAYYGQVGDYVKLGRAESGISEGIESIVNFG